MPHSVLLKVEDRIKEKKDEKRLKHEMRKMAEDEILQ